MGGGRRRRLLPRYSTAGNPARWLPSTAAATVPQCPRAPKYSRSAHDPAESPVATASVALPMCVCQPSALPSALRYRRRRRCTDIGPPRTCGPADAFWYWVSVSVLAVDSDTRNGCNDIQAGLLQGNEEGGWQTKHVPKTPRFFPSYVILQTKLIATSKYAVVNHVKHQFGDSSWRNSYEQQPENVVYQSIEGEFARKLIINNSFCFVVYVTYEYHD